MTQPSAQWAIPEYSRRRINRAGDALRDLPIGDLRIAEDIEVANNWRSSHSFPLRTIQSGVRKHAQRIYENATISQRLKRTRSIQAKLIRFHNMNLSQMQDLGGCRVVMRNVKEVRRVIESYESSQMRHRVVDVSKDYISHPKRDGYRSVHRVYQYQSDKNNQYNKHLIEVQYRTILQHAWATAVETVDMASAFSLKQGSGPSNWKRFFALASSVFAEAESTTRVPYTPRITKELLRRTKAAYLELDVANKLQSYKAAVTITSMPDYASYKYHLLQLIVMKKEIMFHHTGFNNLARATARYHEMEQDARSTNEDVVLVSTANSSSLLRAYPNYVLDTNRFITKLEEMI